MSSTSFVLGGSSYRPLPANPSAAKATTIKNSLQRFLLAFHLLRYMCKLLLQVLRYMLTPAGTIPTPLLCIQDSEPQS